MARTVLKIVTELAKGMRDANGPLGQGVAMLVPGSIGLFLSLGPEYFCDKWSLNGWGLGAGEVPEDFTWPCNAHFVHMGGNT